MGLFGPSPMYGPGSYGPGPYGPPPYMPPGAYAPVGSYRPPAQFGGGSLFGATQTAPPPDPRFPTDTYQPSRYSPFYRGEALPPVTPESGMLPSPTMNMPSPTQSFSPPPGSVPQGLMMPPQGPMIPPPLPPADPQATGIPARRIPPGPVYADLSAKLQEEMGVIKDVPAALKVVGFHYQQADQLRESARHLIWGARFYAAQAAKLADAVLAQRVGLTPAQIQQQAANLQATRQKAIDYLNKAKEYAVTNYNQAVAATAVYNTLFTGSGPYVAALTGPDRMKVDLKLNEMWTRWIGGFSKTVNGIVQQADPLPLLIDKATQDVTMNVAKINGTLQQLGVQP